MACTAFIMALIEMRRCILHYIDYRCYYYLCGYANHMIETLP